MIAVRLMGPDEVHMYEIKLPQVPARGDIISCYGSVYRVSSVEWNIGLVTTAYLHLELA